MSSGTVDGTVDWAALAANVAAQTTGSRQTSALAALPSGGNDPILWTQPAVQEQAASMDIDSSQAASSGLSQPARDLRLSTLAEADAGTLL